MVVPTDVGKTEAARRQSATGIVLELEYLAFPGRRLMYAAMERVLKGKDIALTPVLFSRFAIHPAVEKSLERLLAAVGKKKLSADKLAAEIQEQFLRSVKKSSVRPEAAIEPLLADIAKAKAQVGAISFLPVDVAQELVDRSGLKDGLTLRVMAANARGRSTADGWLKLAKAMNLHPHRCVALTTDAVACKSALVAGMHCVVVPDAYTLHQDFGGADWVVEDPKELRLKDLMALLHPCAFR